MTALCVEQSEEWLSGRRYLDMGGICLPMASEGPLAGETEDRCR